MSDLNREKKWKIVKNWKASQPVLQHFMQPKRTNNTTTNNSNNIDTISIKCTTTTAATTTRTARSSTWRTSERATASRSTPSRIILWWQLARTFYYFFVISIDFNVNNNNIIDVNSNINDVTYKNPSIGSNQRYINVTATLTSSTTPTTFGTAFNHCTNNNNGTSTFMAPLKSGIGQIQIQRLNVTQSQDGVSCCGVCRICTCIKWRFAFTPLGIVKLLEIVSYLVILILIFLFLFYIMN